MALFDFNFYKEAHQEANYFFKVLGWTIPFILGLTSSFIIDKVRNYLKNKKNKKFILKYLERDILCDATELKDEYKKLESNISNYKFGHIPYKSFEALNSDVIKSIPFNDYYEIFGEKFTSINLIKSLIDFLASDLPIRLTNEYVDEINKHLEEENKIGDFEHIQQCNQCKQYKSYYEGTIKLRINETETLIKELKKLLN